MVFVDLEEDAFFRDDPLDAVFGWTDLEGNLLGSVFLLDLDLEIRGQDPVFLDGVMEGMLGFPFLDLEFFFDMDERGFPGGKEEFLPGFLFPFFDLFLIRGIEREIHPFFLGSEPFFLGFGLAFLAFRRQVVIKEERFFDVPDGKGQGLDVGEGRFPDHGFLFGD